MMLTIAIYTAVAIAAGALIGWGLAKLGDDISDTDLD